MTIQLRQVELVAQNLDPARASIFDLFGLTQDFVDPGIEEFGLRNSVMALADTFLEVVSPTRPNTTAGRLLDKRGDGGYMVLAQVSALAPVARRIESLGMRKVWQTEHQEVSAIHLHPKDIGAAIVSFDEMRPATEWCWAGTDWRIRRARHVSSISAVDIQTLDPRAVANRWASAFARDIVPDGENLVMALDQGCIRFEQATNGRGDGVAGIQVDVIDSVAVLEAADRQGLKWDANQINLCGVRFRFRGL